MNRGVAPTICMMRISLRRAKTVRRMVLLMMKRVAIVIPTLAAPPKILTIDAMASMVFTSRFEELIQLISGKKEESFNWLITESIFETSVTSILKASGRGLSSATSVRLGCPA